MKFIDLFAGVGGFHYGITKGIHGSRCVYSNEWDRWANSVYRRHFGECDNRDIRTVDADGLPDFDLLCGGFPCQSFSIAGKRRGFADTRGTLFFEICRILRAKRPRLVLLENVKGLLSHDSGKTFYTIIASLDELGYDCQWQVCNSKDFGVPQNRERIFIVGHTRGTPRPQVFPLTGNDSQTALGPVTASAGRNRATGSNYVTMVKYGTSQDQKVSVSLGQTLSSGHYNQPKVAVRQPLKFLQRNQKNIEGDYAFTVDSVNTGGVKQGMAIRRLTPRECERLQAFPDNWTQYGADGELISDTQRYKMMGNAVTTSVITAIAERLL